MIYELDEIALKIGEIFAPFGEEAAEFVLRRRADTQAKSRCEAAAKQLCVSFPLGFLINKVYQRLANDGMRGFCKSSVRI